MSQETKNIAAVVLAPASDAVIQEREIPVPGAGELLIRNHAIGINPIDWKRVAMNYRIQSYPVVLGSDISGVVAAVGPDVTGFAVGERVVAYAHSFLTANNDNAAFQTYSIVLTAATTKIPKDLSFEDAAMLPMPVATPALSLFEPYYLGLPRPSLESGANAANASLPALLVWSGASATGTGAIQLARAAGITVFATASPHNHAHVLSLGATEVFDYNSPTVVEELIEAGKRAGKPISYAFDTFASTHSLNTITQILSRSSGEAKAKMVHVVPAFKEYVKADNVDNIKVDGEFIFNKYPELLSWLFNDFLPPALERGLIVPGTKLRIVDGGIQGLQEGMNILKSGKVSGERIVVQVK